MVTIQYEVWNIRTSRPRVMEREFKTEEQMQKWVAKQEKKDTWGGVLRFSHDDVIQDQIDQIDSRMF